MDKKRSNKPCHKKEESNEAWGLKRGYPRSATHLRHGKTQHFVILQSLVAQDEQSEEDTKE